LYVSLLIMLLAVTTHKLQKGQGSFITSIGNLLVCGDNAPVLRSIGLLNCLTLVRARQ
jgi:hypothetical protein